MELLFFASAGMLSYLFVGYPLLLFLRSRFTRKSASSPLQVPVTLIISAYNEAGIIRQKLENTFALTYPSHLLEIIVVSDASTDDTDAIVSGYAGRVTLLRIEGRKGKTHCQNEAASRARGAIIIFSDANSMYRPDALTHLIAPFADARIGMTYGALTYVHPTHTEEPLYWSFETLLKQWESDSGTCIGVSGAIYAVRKETFVPPPDTAQADFAEPFLQRLQGRRTRYVPEAICTEVPVDSRKEYDRKIRIVHGAFRTLPVIKRVLNPFHYGWYAIALWSHKVIRWFMVVPLLGAWIASAFLLSQPFFLVVFILQTIFYLCALLGHFFSFRACSIPYHFTIIQIASAVAIARTIRGKEIATWETVRGEQGS